MALEKSKSVVIMVCGFRRMGKDTFFKSLKKAVNPKFQISDASPFGKKYEAYVRNKECVANLENLVRKTNMVKRIALADSLKELVVKHLNMSADDPLKLLDELKDKPLPPQTKYEFKWTEPLDPPTYRCVMIDVAKGELNKDPLCWVKRIVNKIQPSVVNIITDCRYPHEMRLVELIDVDLITVRVHRKGVPIPDEHISSEHSMDGTLCDILFLNPGESPKDFPELHSGYGEYHHVQS